MSMFFRAAALTLLVLSRAPAFAAPLDESNSNQTKGNQEQNQISPSNFKHSLSGLYGINPVDTDVAQPHADFDVLYSKAHQAQHELESLCKSTALLTQTDAQFSGVKSSERALEKINTELNGEVNQITDLARATIVANDVSSLVSAFEALSREAKVVRVKNRFKSPNPSGYRDLNLLVQLPKTGIVAEVQLHLKAIADVKNGPEHDLYEIIQGIERNAATHNRSLNDIETAQITSLRRQSMELYQNAWQPYITTHIQAA
ncbi:phosphoribosylglycinamide formyltransferase [Vibrio sp. 10N.286.49.C2]|uniref:RelA/SpoT domain-containing protein n=1 Tax=unclassified Vibrio TaxID=2614977 RepID=UPI000C8377F0|nr:MULTISPECIES: RelA/SpoT domain-containing protein [unclassified Vibrio]PMH37205.1 phosphoribosylglycinamide formyltransferase [Vibrio sp. 10N.286.49.C2]PMH57350.1 phosphoribosylglycinamide formyltransferase [Vibrio sp. 10N.286.49.B1]PMH83951.1 phosphoribosylglycinamide formyltransferase [Vibrio sp. 10N.286.48.B7]